MRRAEPAALVEGVREHALKLRRGLGHEPLRAREPLRIRQRPHRRLDLLVGEHQARLVIRGRSRPITEPASAPPTAAPMFASSVVSDSSTSTAAIM